MPWKKIPFADEAGGSVEESEGTPEIVSSLQLVSSGAGRCRGIDIYGRYAYVASTADGKLHVVDIKNPEDLIKIGEVRAPTSPLPDCRYPIAAGRYVFTEGYDTEGTAAIHTIDVSDPSAPEIVAYSQIKVSGRKIMRDKFIYGCDGYYLKIIDASDPYNLEQISSINPYSESVEAVDVRGKIAVVCGYHRVATIDVSDPHNPTVVGTLTDYSNLGDSLRDVKIVGRYAVIADFDADAVAIVDISDPDTPTFVSRVSSSQLDGCWGVEATDRYVYACADKGNYFTIVDISDSSSPSIVASIHDDTLLDGVHDCKLYGKYAIAVTVDSGYIVSIKLKGYSIPNIRTQGITANRVITEYVNVDKHIKAMSGTFHKLYSTKFYPKIINSDSEPTLTDGEMVIWHDAINDKYYLLIRYKGIQKKVELI